MRSVAARGLALLLAALCSVGIAAADAISGDSAVDEIGRRCLQIDNNLATYPSFWKDFTIGEEHGALTAYGPRNEPEKLVAQVVGSSGGAVTEYYFAGGSLIYLVEVNQLYGAGGDPTKTSLTEDRYYFSNGALSRWLHGSPSPEAGSVLMQPSPEKTASLDAALRREARLWLEFLASPLTDFDTFMSVTAER